MKKGLIGKVSLFSVVLLAISLILIFVLPVFSIPFISTETPSNLNASVTNQLLNFTIININATGNITQVNITLPSGFGFIVTSNATTAGNTLFSNTSNVISWSNTTGIGFVFSGGDTQYFSINVSVPSVASASYNFNVSTLDTAGAYNSTNVTVAVNDITSPVWSSPSNFTLSTYSPTTPSEFNITFTDNVAISKVLIELIDGGTPTNYTMSNTYGGNIYNYTRVLSANDGNPQYWKVYANDTSGNWNVSNEWDFTMQKADNPVSLYLNNTKDGNHTYTYPEVINATAASLAGNANLFRNDASVSSPDDVLLGAGSYAYRVNATGNVNYSDNTTGITFYANVGPGTPDVKAFIDGSPTNKSVQYPTIVTIKGNSTTTTTPPTFVLYVDSTSLGSGNPVSVTEVSPLAIGTYNIIYNTSGNDNWTSASNSTIFLIVSQNSSNPVKLTINNGTALDDQNVSITYGTSITASCSNVYSDSGSCYLYRDGSLVTNITNETIILSATTYAYKVNTSGNANYSPNSTGETFYVIVNKAPTSAILYLNGSASSQNSTYPNSTINVTAASSSGGLGIDIWMNGVLIVSSGSTIPISYNAYLNVSDNNFTAQILGDVNYSDSINTTLWWNVSKGTLSGSITGSDVAYPSPVSVTLSKTSTGDADVNYTLWRNTTLVSSSLGSAPSADTSILVPGTYVYALNSSGGANYFSNSSIATKTITISKGNPASTMNISINGTANDSTLTYPYPTNVTGWSTITGQSNLNFTLYRNNVNISNVNSTPYTIDDEKFFGFNTYTYIFNTSGNANYTNGTVTRTLTISQGTPTPSLTSSSWSVTYPTSTTVLCTIPSTNNEVTAYLFRDSTNVTSTENNTAASLAVGTYVYICNSSATTNYSASSINQTLTVGQASPSGIGGSSSLGGITSTGMITYINLAVGKANITANYLTTSGKLIANIARYQDVAFRGMNVTVVNNVAKIKIMISKLPSLPSNVPYDINGKVYNYISVGEQNFTDADIKSVSIYFAVNKTWLTNNNIDASNITLYRWANNKWNDLSAVKVSDNGNEVFFTVSSPGLSVFIIGTKGGAPVVTETPTTCTESWSCSDWSTCANSEQTRTCTDANSCGTTASKPIESQSCTVSIAATTVPSAAPVQTSILTMVIIIVIAIIACVFIFLQRDKINSYLVTVTENNNNRKNLDILARKANKIEEEEEEKFNVRVE